MSLLIPVKHITQNSGCLRTFLGQQCSKFRLRSLQWAQQTVSVLQRVYGLLLGTTGTFKCRRTAACGLHALETHRTDSQRQTWRTSCDFYCLQDLELNRPWQNFTLLHFGWIETLQPITAVTANLHVHEDVTPCQWVNSCRRFEGSQYLHVEIQANPLRLFDIVLRNVENYAHTESTSRLWRLELSTLWESPISHVIFVLLTHRQLAHTHTHTHTKHMNTWTYVHISLLRVSAVDRTAIIRAYIV